MNVNLQKRIWISGQEHMAKPIDFVRARLTTEEDLTATIAQWEADGSWFGGLDGDPHPTLQPVAFRNDILEICGNCRFADVIQGIICRRFPPVQNQSRVTWRYQWCGEYKQAGGGE